MTQEGISSRGEQQDHLPKAVIPAWCTQQAWKQFLFPLQTTLNHPVPAIMKDHKLYINLHIIALMFTWNTEKSLTWDVHKLLDKNTPNINYSVHNNLKVPITDINEDTINFGCIHWACKPPIGFSWGGGGGGGGLPREVREIKNILR